MTKKTSFFPGIFLPYHLVTREPYSWSGWFRTSFRFQGLLQRYSGNRWKQLRNVNPFMVKPVDWGSCFIMLYHPISRSSKYIIPIIPIIPNAALGMVYDSLSHNFPWLFPNHYLWLSYDPSKYSQWMARMARVTSPWHLQVLLLVGEPGSGKTTQLPQILLDAGYHVTHQPGQVRAICCALPQCLAPSWTWGRMDGLVHNGWITGVSYGTNLMIDTYIDHIDISYRHII